MEECEAILSEDEEPNPDQLEETRQIIKDNPDMLRLTPRSGGYLNKSRRQTDINVSHDVTSWLIDDSTDVDIATEANPTSSRMVRIFDALDHWPQDLTRKERKNKREYQHKLLCLAISTVISLAAGPTPQPAFAPPTPPLSTFGEEELPMEHDAAGNEYKSPQTEEPTEEFMPNADNPTAPQQARYNSTSGRNQQQSSMYTPRASQLTYDYLRLIKDEQNHIPLNVLGILKLLTISDDPNKSCFCSS